eukprot:m.264022 g.264022  ORF g.264022 m.264022 type:complete len:210 (+) comp53507_c0_seq1:106-735(+)
MVKYSTILSALGMLAVVSASSILNSPAVRVALKRERRCHITTPGDGISDDCSVCCMLCGYCVDCFGNPGAVPCTTEAACHEWHEMSVQRMTDLCPTFQVDGGTNGFPVYGPDAVVCGKGPGGATRVENTEALHLSMANALFGGDDSDRDCKAWCVWDVRNADSTFRWNHAKKCWKFKENVQQCTDANSEEVDYAVVRQSELCPPPAPAP